MADYSSSMDIKASLLAAIKAAAMGSLIGTSVVTLAALVGGVAIAYDEPESAAMLIVAPFLAGFVAAAIGLIIVGLPMTAWLFYRREESRRAYLVGGLIAGLVPGLFLGMVWGGFYFELAVSALVAVFGALTGGATGHFWWRYARRDIAESWRADDAEIFE